MQINKQAVTRVSITKDELIKLLAKHIQEQFGKAVSQLDVVLKFPRQKNKYCVVMWTAEEGTDSLVF